MKKTALLLAVAASLLSTAVPAAEEVVSSFTSAVNDKLGKGSIKGVITRRVTSAKYGNKVDLNLKIERTDRKGKVLWTVRDFVRDCTDDVDVELEMLAPISITDIDDNGLNEIWMPYKMACRGDVSPAVMKIIMYEGTKKHAMRGTTRIPTGDGETEGGEHTADSALENADPMILHHAEHLWKKLESEF